MLMQQWSQTIQTRSMKTIVSNHYLNKSKLNKCHLPIIVKQWMIHGIDRMKEKRKEEEKSLVIMQNVTLLM